MVLEDLAPGARFRDLTEPISAEEAFAVADARRPARGVLGVGPVHR